MNLADTLRKISPPVGMTSAIAGAIGDAGAADGLATVASILRMQGAPDGFPALLQRARDELAAVEKAQGEAKSDAAYWSYQGSISYWKCAVSLLLAAEITGPDDLPEIPVPEFGGVLMDMCAQMERYGEQVLKAASESIKVVRVGSGTPVPGLSHMAALFLTNAEIEQYGNRILATCNEMMAEGVDAMKLMGCLQVACGQVLAMQGVVLDLSLPVKEVLGPLAHGYEERLRQQAAAAN